MSRLYPFLVLVPGIALFAVSLGVGRMSLRVPVEPAELNQKEERLLEGLRSGEFPREEVDKLLVASLKAQRAQREYHAHLKGALWHLAGLLAALSFIVLYCGFILRRNLTRRSSGTPLRGAP